LLGRELGKIYHRSVYNSRLNVSLGIFRRLFDWKVVMNIKRAESDSQGIVNTWQYSILGPGGPCEAQDF
jgi:hypothetical protein